MKGTFSRIGASIGSVSGGRSRSFQPTPPDKRGEIQQLKDELSDPSLDKDQKRKREVLQKVIAYMTMGLNTSRLFDNVMMNVNTKDVVQKKMVYQYVTYHAHLNPDLAILTINTLARDCRDQSPVIRGLALRSLSSMRLPRIVEHVLPLIKEGLNDPSPYVRKTAVISVMKLNRISPQTVQAENFVERLYTMVRDKDPQVVVNSIVVLNELLEDSGGIQVTQKMAYFLLNRINDWSEWQLSIVLDVLLKYVPSNRKEVFDIMNLLDDHLQLANSAVVMGITSLFLRYTENFPKVHLQVFERMKGPLLLQLSSASNELAHSLLMHIKLMATRAPSVFASSYRDFFIKHHEATYLKVAKLEILALIATEENIRDIMEELHFYATNSDVEIETARKAIRTLGEVAVKISSATEVSLSILLEFIEMGEEHIIAETFVVLKDVLRKYNNDEFCKRYLPQITNHWTHIKDPEATVAFVWILGEYGHLIDLAPYMLERYIDSWGEEQHYTVRNEVLTAAMKLFFARPPEMQAMLGRLFATAIDDTSHADVHDKALFYYRLLETDINMARQVIIGNKNDIVSYAEEESVEFRDRLFSEFNTLSVSFEKPSERFIVKGPAVLGAQEEEEEEEEDDDDSELEEDSEGYMSSDSGMEGSMTGRIQKRLLDSPFDEEDDRSSDSGAASAGTYAAASLLDMGFGASNSAAAERSAPSLLKPNPTPLTPMIYQQTWLDGSLHEKSISLSLSYRPPAKEIEDALKQRHIKCIASNERADPIMFYFYAQPAAAAASGDDYLLIESKIFSSGQMENLVKHSDAHTLEQFEDLFRSALASFL